MMSSAKYVHASVTLVVPPPQPPKNNTPGKGWGGVNIYRKITRLLIDTNERGKSHHQIGY